IDRKGPPGAVDRGHMVRRPQAASVPITVGRTAELARLDLFLEALAERKGAPAALFITGAPGMGQTHLLRELKVRTQTRGLRFCLETGFAGRTEPPGSILQGLQLHMDAAEAEARRRWEAFLVRMSRPRRMSRIEVSEGERRLRRAGELSLA